MEKLSARCTKREISVAAEGDLALRRTELSRTMLKGNDKGVNLSETIAGVHRL